MKKEEEFEKQKPLPFLNIHPGEFLKEAMEDMSFTTTFQVAAYLVYDREGEDVGEYIESHLEDILSGRSLFSDNLLKRFEAAERFSPYNFRKLQENYLETEEKKKEREKEELRKLKDENLRLFCENEILRESKRKIWKLEKDKAKKFFQWIMDNRYDSRLYKVTEKNDASVSSCWTDTETLVDKFEEYFPEVKE